MDDATKRTKRVAYLPPAVKPNYSKMVRSPKKRMRLDASQNAQVAKNFSTTRGGVPLLASRGEVVTLENVQNLMDQEGV